APCIFLLYKLSQLPREHTLYPYTTLFRSYQEKQANELTVPSLSEVEQYDFSEDERKKVAQIKKKMIIGNPTEVKEEITTLQQKYAADEWMVITITHDQVTKFRSYELLSQMWS